MTDIKLHTKSGISKIIISNDYNFELAALIKQYANKGKIFIITDETINSIYHDILDFGETITFRPGESNKTLKTVETIEQKLIDSGANRDSFIIGLGGGIVTDITGFVASTFMRGIKFGFIPTTLLGMVDASIGGKNGVNLSNYKNIIGTFNQPEWIIIDPFWLKSLPQREINAGMAEILKYALLYDSDMFYSIYSNTFDITKLIYNSVKHKVTVVEKDETEHNERRALNFGHTIAHAIEKTYKRRNYLHGEAVAFGMSYIAKVSYKRGLLSKEDLDKITQTIHVLGLELPSDTIDLKKLVNAIKHDKKSIGKGDTIMEIFLNGIGKYQIIPINTTEYLTMQTY